MPDVEAPASPRGKVRYKVTLMVSSSSLLTFAQLQHRRHRNDAGSLQGTRWGFGKRQTPTGHTLLDRSLSIQDAGAWVAPIKDNSWYEMIVLWLFQVGRAQEAATDRIHAIRPLAEYKTQEPGWL